MTTVQQRRLTQFSHCAGCAAKLPLAELSALLKVLPPSNDADLIVDAGDDAAVWRLDDERALIVTADFLTPLVDDPRTWGRIAATNAVSDVYAMGGRPLLAINLVCWPSAELPLDLLNDVLAGAQDVAAAAGFVIAGGHSIDDPEPKFGLAVVGEAHPERLLRNSAFRPGDSLVLTKPVGTGVISTATKAGVVTADALAAMVAATCRSNADAADAALLAGATGATDITGFGLLGHLGTAAAASRVDVTVFASDVPVLAGARELADSGHVSGGTRRNMEWVRDRVDRVTCDPITFTLLCDAQTSGGLLFGAEPKAALDALAVLRASGHEAAVIGSAGQGTGRITVE